MPDKEYMAALNGPRTLAVAVSVAYVIRSIVDLGANPPANQPSVLFPAPAKYPLPTLSGPRILAVAVSVA